MSRVYRRRFDHDEARRRHAAGETIAALARAYGVTPKAISSAVDPETRERLAKQHREWQKNGTCPKCGGRASRTGGKQHRCRACAAKARRTTVRRDALRCVTCDRWLPDRDFPRSSQQKGRRSRHRQCRSCQTIARRKRRREGGR